MNAHALITQLGLTKSPYDGGYFKRTFESGITVEGRPDLSVGSAIYYLVTADDFSRLHQCESDEMYFFLQGSPATLLVIDADKQLKEITLGPDIAAGQHLHALVRGGEWQGLQVRGTDDYALFGVSVCPAFRPTDYAIKNREELIHLFGETRQAIDLITQYTHPTDLREAGLGRHT